MKWSCISWSTRYVVCHYDLIHYKENIFYIEIYTNWTWGVNRKKCDWAVFEKRGHRAFFYVFDKGIIMLFGLLMETNNKKKCKRSCLLQRMNHTSSHFSTNPEPLLSPPSRGWRLLTSIFTSNFLNVYKLLKFVFISKVNFNLIFARKVEVICKIVLVSKWLHLLIPVRVGTGSEMNCGFLWFMQSFSMLSSSTVHFNSLAVYILDLFHSIVLFQWLCYSYYLLSCCALSVLGFDFHRLLQTAVRFTPGLALS